MTAHAPGPVISLMLAVPDASAATAWYATALGATELWNLGSVVGLQIAGAPFFLAEPEKLVPSLTAFLNNSVPQSAISARAGSQGERNGTHG